MNIYVRVQLKTNVKRSLRVLYTLDMRIFKSLMC